MDLFEKITDYIIKSFFLVYSYVSHKQNIIFIPHKEMCINDHYSIINYKSDSALTFARHVLDNNLLLNKNIIIASAVTNNDEITNELKALDFSRNITFVNPFNDSENKWINFKNRITFYHKFATSSHVFTSQTPVFRPLARSKRIKMINLGYYMAPIKDSTHDKKDPFYMGYETISTNDFDNYIVSSEVSKRLIMATYGFKYNQFLTYGLCRNDYLYTKGTEYELRGNILKHVPYKVNKVILYTPTHRDNKFYDSDSSIGKQLMGFDTDLKKLDSFLQKEGFFMICKIHPKQIKSINKAYLPKSITIFEANHKYGLAELMKVSDLLVTDYTSGYFDYLILDKPVIFNLYDRNRYESNRGLIFNHIESICAGEIIYNQNEFQDALKNINNNTEKYRDKRRDILYMLNDNLDNKTCNRIADYYFN